MYNLIVKGLLSSKPPRGDLTRSAQWEATRDELIYWIQIDDDLFDTEEFLKTLEKRDGQN